MLVYICLYIKYDNNRFILSKLGVSKIGSWFDRAMLLMLEYQKW